MVCWAKVQNPERFVIIARRKEGGEDTLTLRYYRKMCIYIYTVNIIDIDDSAHVTSTAAGRLSVRGHESTDDIVVGVVELISAEHVAPLNLDTFTGETARTLSTFPRCFRRLPHASVFAVKVHNKPVQII